MNILISAFTTILFLFLHQVNAQALDNVYFHDNSNFTYCYQSHFTVTDVTRYYNVKNSSYFLNFSSTTNVNVSNLNQQGTTTAASFFQIRFGFKTFQAPPQQFCLFDVASQQCPLLPNQNFTIQRDFNLSDIPFYPLADITGYYSAIDADSNHLVCLKLAPVGYQHPIWQQIFTYVSMGITGYAALLSIVTSFTRFHEQGQHDIFLFSSNDVMLPGVLRLKTPGFFDLMYYSQFIVTTGLLSVSYPRFFPLFVSDFAWSFLLFDSSEWLNSTMQRLFPSLSEGVESIATVPHQSLYKRQAMNYNNSTTTESGTFNVINTGMLNFANAAGFSVNGLFFTFLIYFLLVVAGCLFLCLLTWLIFRTMGHAKNKEDLIIKSKKMSDFTIGVMIRIISLFYLPLLTLAFFQLMIQTYWYITLASALLISISLLIYGFVSIKLLQIRPASFIYTELKLLLRFGSLYNSYTDDTFHFYLAIIIYQSIVAAMVGLFQTSGTAQLIIMILTEVALTIGTFWKWPHPDLQVNMMRLFINFVKTVVLFLNISFLPQMQTTTMAKQYMGYVLLAIHCLVYVIFLLLLIRNTVMVLTGLGDDELDESGNPPARMVLWRKNQGQQLNSSSRLIMSSRSPSATASMLYLDRPPIVDGATTQETMAMLKHYYNPQDSSTAHHKPDEIKRVSLPLTSSTPPQQDSKSGSMASLPIQPSTSSAPPPRNRHYTAQVKMNPEEEDEDAIMEVRTNHYRLDDDIIPATEPLMPIIQRAMMPPPPPLPKHEIMIIPSKKNESSIYSPPHQPSITSIEFRNEIIKDNYDD